MQRYIIKRFFQSLIVILGISVIVFIIIHLTGDPTDLLLPPEAGPEDREVFRQQFGLDKPIYIQYFEYI